MSKNILTMITILTYSGGVAAYVGPGLGVGVIGTIIGVLLSIIMAIVGLFWYPIKRMFKKNDDNEALEEADADEPTEKQ